MLKRKIKNKNFKPEKITLVAPRLMPETPSKAVTLDSASSSRSGLKGILNRLSEVRPKVLPGIAATVESTKNSQLKESILHQVASDSKLSL